MTSGNPIVNLIVQGARARGLDPNAVLAVARQEGLGGGVGDGGHAFGPFQLNDAGGVLTGRPGNHRAFAESPQGINWALDRIAGVARGKRGAAAVNAIVRQFERPRDPNGEVTRALASYSGKGTVAPGVPVTLGGLTGRPTPPPGANTGSGLNPLLASVLQSNANLLGVDAPPLMSPPGVPPVSRPVSPNATAPQTFKRGTTVRFLEHFAAPYGLTVTATTNGSHVKGSYHYRGRAVDFGGNPAGMSALARAALSHPQDFSEMFYTGPGAPGFYIKNGKALPMSSLDKSVFDHHHDHVHIAR